MQGIRLSPRAWPLGPLMLSALLATGCSHAGEPALSDASALGKGDGGDGVAAGGGDAPASEASLAAARFVAERESLRRQRYEQCFRVTADVRFSARPAKPASFFTDAVARGSQRFDAARASGCLASLAALTCAQLLAGFSTEPGRATDEEGCEGVFAGVVAPGASCVTDEDCADGARYACTDLVEAMSCGRRCSPRVPVDDDCSRGACASGLYCATVRADRTPAQLRCAALPSAGQACDGVCALGLFCSREAYDGYEGIDRGICRARLEGTPCRNDWQCPAPLVCRSPASGAGGNVCAIAPVPAGQACRPGADECPAGHSCRAVGASFLCRRWPAVGEPCGYLQETPGTTEVVRCAAGFCDLAPGVGRGVCTAARGAGISCRSTAECTSGLVCAPGANPRATICQARSTGMSAGAPCSFWNRCADGLRCLAGSCKPFEPAAAACRDPGGEQGVAYGQPVTGTFRQVAVHGTAIRQPTPLGRRIGALEPWKGRLYLGYGDYEANGGPISISYFDPASAQIVDESSFDTEAIALYRPIGNALFVPATDPHGTGTVDYATGPPWSTVSAFAATHAFDAATFDGSDLWIVGSQGSEAVAWRSTDGGVRWEESLREKSPSGLYFARYYFAAVLGNRLYVEAVPNESGTSRMFDGAAWTAGPNLLPTGGQGWNPRVFHGDLVYLSWEPIGPRGGSLLAFDGATVRPLLLDDALDFAVGADAVYVLGADLRVRRSSDLVHWWVLGLAPEGARSVALLDGHLYVGATEGRLFVLEESP